MATLRAYIFGFATVLGILLAVLALDRSYQDQFRQEARLAVLTHLTAVRARLEGALLGDLAVLSALGAFATNFPDTDDGEFARFARELVEASPQLRGAFLAPEDRVTEIYPPQSREPLAVPPADAAAGNETHEALQRLRRAGGAVLTGPVAVAGGRILVGRQALYRRDVNGVTEYWGHVGVSIDLDELFLAAGLGDVASPINLAVLGYDGNGRQGQVILGDPDLFGRAAVRTAVTLPGGAWTLAAEPVSGWDVRGETLWLLRVMGIFVAGTCAALVFVAFRFHERIQHKALHDELTGLPNRALLSDRLDQALAAADRGGHRVAVLALDLDDFKPINDTLGHEVGDEVLQSVAERLRNLLRGSDSAARLGGDEFVVVLSQIQRASEAGDVAQRIVDSISAPYRTSGGTASTGVSIGISVFPEDGATWQDLLILADHAMYEAKHLGKNRYRTVPPDQRQAFQDRQAAAVT